MLAASLVMTREQIPRLQLKQVGLLCLQHALRENFLLQHQLTNVLEAAELHHRPVSELQQDCY
jgi:hypothetical protein